MNTVPGVKPSIVLRTHGGIRIIPINEVVFCKATGSYSTIHLDNGSSVMISKTLIVLEKYLNNKIFIRCHKSYLINALKIEKMNRKSNSIIVLGKAIPVSRRHWQDTLRKLNDLLSL